MKLIIEDDEGRKTVVPFVREEITIGRQEGNTIRLTERNVSRRHARLIRHNGHVLVEDLGSYNGIRINGEKIQGQVPIKDGDLVQIGDYDLAIQTEVVAPPPPPEEPSVTAPSVPTPDDLAPSLSSATTEEMAPVTAQEIPVLHPVPEKAAVEQEARARQQTSIIRVDQLEDAHPKREIVDLDPEEAPRLFVLNTEFAGREFACIRTELKIGRTDDNDISLDHRSLSRTHAKIVREDTGEWRVVDMQSANGISLNGEKYAQASLRSGDILELGHLKMKFLLAGETFRFRPEETSGRRWPLVLAIAVLLVGGAGFAAWKLVLPKLRADVVPPEVVGRDQPEKPVSEGPAVQVAAPEEKLKGAQDAMDAHEFEKAIDILESIHNADGSRPAQVEPLLAKAQLESSARKAIAQAQKQLATGDVDGAIASMGAAEKTVAFAKDLQQLKEKVASVKASVTVHPAPPTNNPTPPAAVTTKAPATDPTAESRKYLDEGTALFKRKQFREAKVFFTRCVDLDPKSARCHKMLGSTYASLRDVENGAKHYRLFVKLAPDDPDAPKVRQLLEEYDRRNHE